MTSSPGPDRAVEGFSGHGPCRGGGALDDPAVGDRPPGRTSTMSPVRSLLDRHHRLDPVSSAAASVCPEGGQRVEHVAGAAPAAGLEVAACELEGRQSRGDVEAQGVGAVRDLSDAEPHAVAGLDPGDHRDEGPSFQR